MRKGLAAVIILLGLLFEAQTASADMPAPGSSQFGQHIASMAPEHPKNCGPMFGACVSTMATTGNCSHHGG